MRGETQSAPYGSANSRSPASPTPSAHRTGAPTARSRSSRTTSSSRAACLASHAATAPAGPAPTTRTSTSGMGGSRAPGAGRERDHCQRAYWAWCYAFLTSRALIAIDGQDVQRQMDGFGRAEGETQSATVADREVHDGDCVGGHATHGRKASRAI